MTGKVIAAVGGGILCGRFLLTPELLAGMDQIMSVTLAAMVFLVGVDIGRNRQALGKVRDMGWKVAFIPLAVGVGSLLGAAVMNVFLQMPLKEVLAVSAGFGWYSLSGLIIAQSYSVELGAVAFLANVFRELLTFLLLPLLVLKLGRLPAIGAGGATTMDSTLPLITKLTDSQTALLAFVNGLVLSGSVPLLVPFFLTWG